MLKSDLNGWAGEKSFDFQLEASIDQIDYVNAAIDNDYDAEIFSTNVFADRDMSCLVTRYQGLEVIASELARSSD